MKEEILGARDFQLARSLPFCQVTWEPGKNDVILAKRVISDSCNFADPATSVQANKSRQFTPHYIKGSLFKGLEYTRIQVNKKSLKRPPRKDCGTYAARSYLFPSRDEINIFIRIQALLKLRFKRLNASIEMVNNRTGRKILNEKLPT